MQIENIQNFYKQDQRKYKVKENKELLNWLENTTKKGYHLPITINELQKIIDDIAYYYESIYPKAMDINELINTVSNEVSQLLKCEYHGGSGKSVKTIYNKDGKITGKKSYIYLWIESKFDYYHQFDCIEEEDGILIIADAITGEVTKNSEYKLYNLSINKGVSLESLLLIFRRKFEDKLEYSDLEKCVYYHQCDMILRKKILQMIALKLLYSNKINPEIGYEMAISFINEFNKLLGLNLTTHEIDTIMNKDTYQQQTNICRIRRKTIIF